MLFNTFQFAAFFVLVYVLYRATPRERRGNLLLGASFVFYFLWIPSYLLLLLGDLVVNFALMRLMTRSRRPGVVLATSIVFTLGLLGTFKYAAMFVETIAPVLAAGFGLEPAIPEIFLPLGISFYSFQIIALQVDIYRGNSRPVERFARYALFISFFPQLIAGPILRGHEFLGQLERGGEMTRERNRRGLWLVASGLVKKVVFADFLLAPFVDEIFGTPDVASAQLQWIAVYSFTFQIYFDFSGYCDIARGLALWLGFELPLNFEEPYLSKDPAEFWRRWHITLSRWLRDYIFMPLAERRGPRGAGFALFMTMTLGGLWHGAAWNFALWGVYHGAILVAHRVVAPVFARTAPRTGLAGSAWNAVCMIATFHMVAVGLAIFRAASLDDVVTILSNLVVFDFASPWPTLQAAIVALCGALHFVERSLRLRLPAWQRAAAHSRFAPLGEGLAFGVVVGIAIATSGTGGEFIYFQF
ncbi:MAG: MBOAT family O-acyltransferase [Myxococcota bacterium]|jgi:D-alanyl-lipoteichoic acid acyltransferase DltB (MBOAT superfamily)|nr:MBOAT family O-acyltransferase [Myxococcota bacterium]